MGLGLTTIPLSVKGELFGSLGATGKGHASDIAVILGFLGETPDTIEPLKVKPMLDEIEKNSALPLNKERHIEFLKHRDIILNLEESLRYLIGYKKRRRNKIKKPARRQVFSISLQIQS